MPQPPPGSSNAQGRYELRPTSQWVEGRYEQVWVPQTCDNRPYRMRANCSGGFYDHRWVPAHYEQVQNWVWVPRYAPPQTAASYWY